MVHEKCANVPDQSTGAVDGGDMVMTGDSNVGANDKAVGPASFPLLTIELWHLLVRLPDWPSK